MTSHDYPPDQASATAAPEPSKSQRKREALALHRLGEELAGLTPDQLAKLPLGEEALAALLAIQSMHQHGARRRQLRLIGKLLRHGDPEPLQAALTGLHIGSAASKRQQHQLETLRAALMAGDQAALEALFERYPRADRQHLRHLIRSAQREHEQGQPPRASRALFRYLRALLGDYNEG